MPDLFRFIALRPPVKADPEKTVALDSGSSFQADLKKVATGPSARAQIQARAGEFFATNQAFIKDASTLKYAAKFQAFRDALEGAKSPTTPTALAKIAHDAFGKDASDVVADFDYTKQDRPRVLDTIVATMISSEAQRKAPLDRLVGIARLMALLERIAQKDPELGGEGAVENALTRTLRLPVGLFPLPTDPPRVDEPPPSTPPDGPGTVARRRDLLAQHLKYVSALKHLATLQDSAYVPPPPPPKEKKAAAKPAGRDAAALVAKVDLSPLILTSEAARSLPADVRHVLTAQKLDLTETPVPLAAAKLRSAMDDNLARLRAMPAAPPQGQRAVRVGGQRFEVPSPGKLFQNPGLYNFPDVPQPADSPGTAPPAPPVDGQWQPPAAPPNGSINPSGWGDLLVVRHTLKRYEAGEIAHIENILKSEKMNRTATRSKTIDTTISTEREEIREEERDLQSTERYELKREVENTLKEDLSVKAGLAVSAQYGGMVEINTNLDVAYDQAKEESAKQSSAYGKDVTTRSVVKVTERIREQQIIRTIESFQEVNEHEFNNVIGTEHVVGIYQWVDKIFDSRVINYGQRLMFDFTVPEPAAFLLDAMKVKQAAGDAIDRPPDFGLTPGEIDETNWAYWTGLFGATGVNPPPPLQVVVSHAWNKEATDTKPESTLNSANADFMVPDGYEAQSGFLVALFSPKTIALAEQVSIVVGKVPTVMHIFDYAQVKNLSLNNETGVLPVTIQGTGALQYAVSLEVTCNRTDVALAKWQLATHAAILQQQLKLKTDYETKLAERRQEQQQTVQFGTNPASNQKVIQNELKKSCISLLTAQHYESFDAIQEDIDPNLPNHYPELRLLDSQSQGSYIRFFEQAFEWENIMYFFYPYYWGRKATWYDQALIDDNDPMFADFLKAGAARVVVPVRPKFDKAVVYWLNFGKTWNGGDLPHIGDDTYLSIVDEIKAAEKAPGTEKGYGDPWELRLPTELVLLKPDAKLPEWEPDQSDPPNWKPSTP